MNIYIISENAKGNDKWICDRFKDEFEKYSGLNIASNIEEADIIWILAPWAITNDHLNLINLKKHEKIITTIHHIDQSEKQTFDEYYNKIEKITDIFHVICPKVETELKIITTKKIICVNFWINENIYYNIQGKDILKDKYKLPKDKFIIGSFQKDTMGKKNCIKPKLSKGPDIFIDILNNMKKEKEIFVILTGKRRNYITNELNKSKIPYHYFEMVPLKELNELYNCLDLYIVASRVEGGPRSIMECSLIKTPIISTNVGISELILSDESIYNFNKFKTYVDAKPNIEHAFDKVSKYTINNNYVKKFANILFK